MGGCKIWKISWEVVNNFHSFYITVDVPTPPVNVVATPRSPDSIRVSWDPPAQAKGKITKYKLLYYMVGETQEHKVEVCNENQNR